MKKRIPPKATYRPGAQSAENREVDSLISTKHALRYLYEEALRNNHYKMALILQDTLICCDQLIQGSQ